MTGRFDAQNEWSVVIAVPKRPTFVIFKPVRVLEIGAVRMDRKGLEVVGTRLRDGLAE